MSNEDYARILNQIEHYENIGSYEYLRQACMEALRYEPHDKLVLSKLTRAYYNIGDYDNCVKTANEALAHQTPYEQGFIYYMLGAERDYASDHKKAAEYFLAAIERRPENAEYVAQYALQLAYLGRFDEAQELLYRAEEMDPHNYYVLNIKFRFYKYWRNDRDIEEDTLSRMLPLSPSPFYMNRALAEFHLKYNEHEEAYEYYIKASLACPGDKKVLKMLRLLEARGFGGAERQKEAQIPDTEPKFLDALRSKLTGRNRNNIHFGATIINNETIRFERIKLYDRRFSVLLPDSFRDMEPGEIKIKYNREGAPECVKTSNDLRTNFSLTLCESWLPDPLSTAKAMCAELSKQRPEDTFFTVRASRTKSRIRFAFFDFIVSARDDDIYHFIAYIPIQKRLLLFVFNTTSEQMREWRPVALQVAQSIEDCGA